MGTVRYTIEDVKNYLIKHDINNECILLSKEYNSCVEPLVFQCTICNKVFKKTFTNLKREKSFCCPSCSRSKNHRGFSIEDVKSFLLINDVNNECTLLSDTYKNIRTPLKLQCNICGEEFERSFENIKTVKHFCCSKCAAKKGGIKNIKYTSDIVK